MEQMQILGLVALLAGIAKTAILFSSKAQNKLTSAFALLCISMILQNVFEFLVALSYYANPGLTALLFNAEILSLILFAYCLLIFSLTVVASTNIKSISLLFGIFMLVCCYLLVTGNLVQGYEQAAYTIISVPAEYYFVLVAYGLFIITYTLATLSYSAITATGDKRTQCRQILIAIVPTLLVLFTVLLMRLLGLKASTGAFLPLATTFFVAMIVVHQSGRVVIFKIKWTVIWKLAVSMRDVKLSEWVGLVEELLVKEAMRETGNNQTDAAKLIKSNQTTVGRKFKKYGENELS